VEFQSENSNLRYRKSSLFKDYVKRIEDLSIKKELLI
jgi:hypothetical protein